MATLAQQLARMSPGVTMLPPVRALPQRAPTPIRSSGPGPSSGASLTDRLIANAPAAAQRLAPAAAGDDGGGGLSGLGWIVGKPLQAGLKALSVFDYPRAAIVGGIRQGLEVGALDDVSHAIADITGLKYTPLARPEGNKEGFQWGELWRDIKKHEGFGTSIIEPQFGGEGYEGAEKWNRAWRIALGFAGDIASDPLMKLGAGTEAIIGGPARAEYANKLLDAQQAVARELATKEGLAAKLPEILQAPGATSGYGGMARQRIGETLARAEEAVPRLTERQGALGTLEDVERIGRRGVNIANPAQLAEMGINQHAVRFAGVPIQDLVRGTLGRVAPETGERAAALTERLTEPLSRGVSRATGPIKERISAVLPRRTPTGEAGQDLSRAMKRILTGEGDISMERALRTVKLDQWIREGGSTFRGFAAHSLRQLDEAMKNMDGAERAALMQQADMGAENIVSLMGPRMIAAAKEAGVTLPEIEGQAYVPHVLSREAFNFLDKMRAGKNPLVDEFRRKMGIRSEDLLEEGGFLQKRIFRPDPKTGEPFKMKIGDKEIVIRNGDLAELEDQLGGVLREAGFEGKLYETDPVEAYKRYIIATERDVGKRYAAKQGATRGYEGLHFEPGDMGPETYDPVTKQPILPRGPGEPGREMAVANPEAQPADSDLFKYVEDEAKTEARNKELARKIPRGKQAKGETQREILQEYQTLGQAQRENIAGRIDETAAAAWNPHREEMAALRKEERAARDQVAEAARMGQQQRLQIDQIDDAIAEADRNITSLQSRIGGITRQARRKVEVQSQMMLDNLTQELDAAQAERQRLVGYFDDAVKRSKEQLPAAHRRAARRAEIAPQRQERKLFRLRNAAKQKAKSDRQWAENYLRGEALDTKTGKSRWISADRIKSAQARLDDPKLQRQYNALFEERNAIASHRTNLLDEAAEHDRLSTELTAKASRVQGQTAGEELLHEALAQKKLANAKKRQAADLIDAHNAVQAKINGHVLERDRGTVRAWNKQQASIDRFSRDIGLGKRVDVAASRRAAHQAELDVQDFARQQAQEAAYQAEPPPASLTEHYGRELPKAQETLQSPETQTLTDSRKRLDEIDAALKQNPEPTIKDVSLPEGEWITHGVGHYEMKVGEGELDRYLVEHITIPDAEGGAKVQRWVTTVPGEQMPELTSETLRAARKQITSHREMIALGEAKRAWRAQNESLNVERQQLREYLDRNPIHGERVAHAERVKAGAEANTKRVADIVEARGEINKHGTALDRLNAKADLERALQTPEPKWEPGAEQRAEFDARHAEWEQQQKSAKTQLNKVKRQLRDMGENVSKAQSARDRLNLLEAEAAREFENVPKAQRPPFFADIEERNAANIAAAGDKAATERAVAARWEPQAAEAVAQEKMAAAKLGRAAGVPGEMIPEGAPGYNKPLPVGAGAEETAAGVPTTVEGIAMQVARGTDEVPGAMPEIAAARQRIEELHAGITMNEADREVVEQAQAEWFAPYNEGIENQRVARARYKEIETKAAGLKEPRSAVAMTEGKRGGRPFGSQLNLVEQGQPIEAKAAGNLAGVVGSPAYEAQPIYRTIEDINKVIAANPNGDDALMNRIEAEVGNHLTQLDKLTREYDLPAHSLNRIIKQANNGTLAPVLKRQLREGFEYMWEGGDVIIDKELKAIYFNVAKQLDSKLFGRTFTMLTDFFKTYATLTPGFHVRNALSAIFMNSSEGVKMATQRDGIVLWRKFINAEDPVAWMRGQDKAVQDAFRATFASGAGGQFLERGVSELRAGGARVSERVFANKMTRLSQRVGSDWVEGPVRLALGLDSTRGGMTVTDAMNRITRIHFDYGQVSRFDEKAKRVIPFWTFMSRNVPLQFTQMWTKPRTYLKYQSFVRNMQLGATEDPLLPQYIKQGGGFDIGVKTPKWLENLPVVKDLPIVSNLLPPAGMPVVLQPDLPQMRLQDDINRFAGALGGQNPGGVLSNVNPFFTAPFEYAMGKDFFTGKNYGPKDYSQAQGAGIPLAMLLAPVGGGTRGADGNWYLQDKSMNLLRSLVPPLDKQSRLAPGLTQKNSKDQARMLESYIRWLGGPVRTISPEQEKSEAARRYYQARDAAVTRAVTGG